MFEASKITKRAEGWRFIPTWAALRSVGNSRIVQLSAVFPFIGYLILFNESVVHWLELSAAYSLKDDCVALPCVFSRLFALRLHFLYFGLLALGVGSIFYQWKCPYMVKKHGDFSDFVRAEISTHSDEAIAEMGRIVGKNVEAEVDAGRARSGVRTDVLREFFRNMSRFRPWSRIVVTVLFAVGLAFVSVPSIVSAVRIFGSLFV